VLKLLKTRGKTIDHDKGKNPTREGHLFTHITGKVNCANYNNCYRVLSGKKNYKYETTQLSKTLEAARKKKV
jgi:hypothetical protein